MKLTIHKQINKENIPRILKTNSIAVVDQDITIFNASIKDNITLWDESIPELDVTRATKDACIHDDIILRPGGYRTAIRKRVTLYSYPAATRKDFRNYGGFDGLNCVFYDLLCHA